MKKLEYILVLIFILSAANFAQTKFTKLVFLQGIHVDAYNSIGFSNAVSSQISEIASANPAALANFSLPAAGLNFQYASQIGYYYEIKLEKAKQWLPSSLGMVYPMNDLSFGLGYFQKYSNYLDFGKTEITSILQPDGTGEYWEASEETIIHSPSVLFSYSMKNLVQNGDRLSVGGQLFWDIWLEEDKVYKTTGSVNTSIFNWKAGLIYNFQENVGLGICFEKGVDMEGELKMNPELQFASDPTDTSGYFQGVQLKYINTFELPDKLAIGVSIKSGKDLTASASMTSVFWSSVNDRWQDQLDLSANIIYAMTNYFDFTLGVYVNDWNIKEDSYFGGPSHHATFFDYGVRAHYENIGIFAEILDSHLFSSEKRKQTILKMGLSYKIE